MLINVQYIYFSMPQQIYSKRKRCCQNSRFSTTKLVSQQRIPRIPPRCSDHSPNYRDLNHPTVLINIRTTSRPYTVCILRTIHRVYTVYTPCIPGYADRGSRDPEARSTRTLFISITTSTLLINSPGGSRQGDTLQFDYTAESRLQKFEVLMMMRLFSVQLPEAMASSSPVTLKFH